MPHHHPKHARLRAPLAVLAASSILLLGALPAGAEDPKPVDDIRQRVQQADAELPQPPGDRSPGATERRASAPPVARDDDSEGHETPDPRAPDHGSSRGLEADIADNELVSVATTDSEIEDNHSSSADATALAIGGQEVLGSHADSGGDRNDSDGDPLAPLCEGSDGGVCASLLYSEAHASEGRTRSDSSAASGVASVCLGGSDPSGSTCDGPIGAGVIESWSVIHRDGSGHTSAESGSSVADACVAPDPVLGTCTVGVDVLQSSGSSDSRGHAEKRSRVLGLELGDQGGDFTEPTAIAIPPGCTSPSLACLFLNQGETYLSNSAAGHAVEPIHLSALDGTILAHAAQSETLVHKARSRDGDGPKCPGGPNCPGGPGGPGGPGDNAGPPDGGDTLLPDTGGFWSGLLAVGFLAIAAGAFLVAWARRRELIDGTA